ncbi:MAG: DUF4149 domain-containing protein [Rhodospirillaceae bacterium]|mgnify:CR=1 FL=1|nr:DUF4149 domain-containing protein [Rhodospirillaceae bacterium]MBT4940113.1 DUF4149 domain-containing protein [Rhodospirillaceae bacterium]MBT5941440.1 DUF4149 domain-containing protein [Rhodospirillaceae bacterium]MBT7266825.1 DUF4149 domain-containing protein [Rhodospirillaceae bacterium]
MFEWLNLHVLALIAVALQFGGMAYFAFLFTPMVFKFVDREDASKFLRQVFPVYYRTNAVISILPALLLIPGQSYEVEVGTMLAVAAGFLFAARVIVPMANKAREESNDAKFKAVHRSSVILHMIQFVAVVVILVRLAQ